MPQIDKELELKITRWLETQGYPLEMAVAREFQRNGFKVLQSDYYFDPESNTSREIDINTHMQRYVGSCLVRLSLCIECKSSQDKPWIIFTSGSVKLADPARIVQRTTSSLGKLYLQKLSRLEDIQTLNMFSLPARAGYGITQAFTSGKDIPYEATLGAAKCASAEAQSTDKANTNQGPICHIIFPVVITNGRLFESYLDDKNEVVVSEIEMGVLVWRNPLVHLPHTIVRISTVKNLPKLVSDAKEVALKLFAHENEMVEILGKLSEDKDNQRKALLAQRKVKRR